MWRAARWVVARRRRKRCCGQHSIRCTDRWCRRCSPGEFHWHRRKRATLDLGNGTNGVLVNTFSDSLIGGSASGEGNVIANNTINGVVIKGFSATTGVRNTVRGNSIFNNGALGIDLNATFDSGVSDFVGDGVTPNDPLDVDTNDGNELQNFPMITSVTGAAPPP